MEIKAFIKKEIILLAILFLMFLNPFSYGYRIAMLLGFFVGFKLEVFIPKFDKNVFYLFLFAFSFEFIAAISVDAINKTLISIFPDIFIPSLLYWVGKYLSINYQSGKIRIFILFFIAFSFSIIPLISILYQILENGFSGIRSMYLIWDKNFEIAATGLGGYFALNIGSIGLINSKINTQFSKRILFGVIVLFLLSLICVFRLGTRTELVIALISVLASYLINIRKRSFRKNLLTLSLFVFVYIYIYTKIDVASKFLSFYQDRLNSSQVGVATAGGRTQLWGDSINAIFTNPFGWKLSRFGYAHNLWLDVARESGVIPLFILILFTISSIWLFFKSLKILRTDIFLRTYIFAVFISIILVFNVEPIMDGMYLLFLTFCLFIGFLAGIVNQKKHSLVNKNAIISESFPGDEKSNGIR